MTKVMTRVEFAALMSEAVTKFPVSNTNGNNDNDAKFNAWLRASDVLASVGEPFASYEVPDATREDGFKSVPLRKLADVPLELLPTILEAMRELKVAKIR